MHTQDVKQLHPAQQLAMHRVSKPVTLSVNSWAVALARYSNDAPIFQEVEGPTDSLLQLSLIGQACAAPQTGEEAVDNICLKPDELLIWLINIIPC